MYFRKIFAYNDEKNILTMCFFHKKMATLQG